MDLTGTSSNANPHQNDSSGGSLNAGNENLTEEEVFVNHGELAWYQMRAEWVGDRSKKSPRPPKGSTKSLTGTYEELFASKEPFKPPIPLSVMVNFLVESWYDEGLLSV